MSKFLFQPVFIPLGYIPLATSKGSIFSPFLPTASHLKDKDLLPECWEWAGDMVSHRPALPIHLIPWGHSGPQPGCLLSPSLEKKPLSLTPETSGGDLGKLPAYSKQTFRLSYPSLFAPYAGTPLPQNPWVIWGCCDAKWPGSWLPHCWFASHFSQVQLFPTYLLSFQLPSLLLCLLPYFPLFLWVYAFKKKISLTDIFMAFWEGDLACL